MMSRSLRASASQTPTEPLPAASWADQDETAAELPALPSVLRRVCLPDAPDGISSCPNTLGAPCSERDTENSAPCTAPLVPLAPCGGKTNYPLTRVDSYRPDHFMVARDQPSVGSVRRPLSTKPPNGSSANGRSVRRVVLAVQSVQLDGSRDRTCIIAVT